MGIFGGGKAVEPQYKKIAKNRLIKTGMSEQLRQVDKDFTGYDHLEALSDAQVTSSVPKVQEWAKKLKTAADSVGKVFQKKVDWTSDEQTFLKKLIKEINDQQLALTQMIKKAQEEAKKPSVNAETLKLQKAFLETGVSEWNQKFGNHVQQFEQFNGYLVGTQSKLLSDPKVPAQERLDHFNTFMPRLKENIDGSLKGATRDYELLRKKLEALYKNAKILSNNTDVKKLDAKVREQDTKITEAVKALDKKVSTANTLIANFEKTLKEAVKKEKMKK